MMVTAYVSNRSAAMPAQSPTLSPTLSAITAGLRGSSSGMPASTLQKRSAPTAAPLVKMPPPSRAKIENSEGPDQRGAEAERDHCFEHAAQIVGRQDGAQQEVIAARAEQPEADHQHAGDRAG